MVVSSTGRFEGNDGKWSTFNINVNSDSNGENGQNFRVLASTSSPITLLPRQDSWCNAACAARRGVQPYKGEQSVLGLQKTETWKDWGIYDIPLPYWYPDTFLNKTANKSLNGLWGLTNVGLGETSNQSPVLENCPVAGFTFQDFFMGSFGLAVGDVGTSSGATKTFISQYEARSQIASHSYAYGAGAYYRK
jgi:hypothetical protein